MLCLVVIMFHIGMDGVNKGISKMTVDKAEWL